MQLTKLLFASFAFSVLFTACWSSPIRLVAPPSVVTPALPLGSFEVKSCDKTLPVDALANCQYFHSTLTNEIAATGVFTKAIGASPNFVIELLEIPHRHANPGFTSFPPAYVLSAVFPFWEHIEYGYLFSIQDNNKKIINQIDSRQNGVFVMWGPAVVLNLFQERVWERTGDREAEDLRNRLLNVVVNKN